MSPSPQLQLRQSQSLVMTQQLQQSIKLLQMNALELQTFLAQECEQNPFLTMEEGEAPEGEDVLEAVDSVDSAEDQQPDEAPESATAGDDVREVTVDAPAGDDDWSESTGGEVDQTAEYNPTERTAVAPRGKDGEMLEGDEFGEQKPTLKEHLAAQLAVEIADPVEQLIGTHLIDLVDAAGYIHEDLGQLAEQLGADFEAIERTLEKLQRFDPAGICARNLSECLALQLKDLNRFDPAMQALLDNLDLLAAGKLDALVKACGVDEEDIKQMAVEIRALNPKPGLAFEHEVLQAALPDIIVRREGGNKWRVELNTATLPRVLVNRQYHAEIVTHAKGADKKYVSDQMNTANWLAKALDQRANTIVKVATELVTQQEAFFKMGIHHLKPLTLKDVAQATGYHESTISRVTTSKYMMTPRGLFELKYFFTSGLSHGAGGDDVSSQTVKYLIKEMIDGENAVKPLSDDEIASRLQQQNINVARRTVAKYREALGIASSMQRRRLRIA